MHIKERLFGKTAGKEVMAITLTNRSGASITAMTYGASLLEWSVPDKAGKFDNITLAFDNLDDYVTHRPFYGATVGRVAGRIAHGSFEMDGDPYQLETNQETNHLHGGNSGLDTKVWDYQTEQDDQEARIIFSYLDAEGSNRYPGNLKIQVTYTFTEDNEWKIDYQAETDAPTLFNPTNHVYFNLHGTVSKTILDHQLFVDADRFVELNEQSIPTGRRPDVAGTPFDFRTARLTSQATESTHSQTLQVSGLDHPFVLNHDANRLDASLYDPQSGRKITMKTSEPVVVIFMHNGASPLKIANNPIPAYAGITLETQDYPDAINQAHFGSIVLRPGETYRSETTYSFHIE